jgi:chromosome segregation ATPase
MNAISFCALLLLCLQSLADVAREEAERRRALDQQGIEAKVIESIPQSDGGHLTLSNGPSPPKTKESLISKERISVLKISDALQRLDRGIRQMQDRLELLRARLQSVRWAIPKTGKMSGQADTEKTQNRLRQEIERLEKKLVQLQQERADAYDRGRKAGFLPGELTGKGIIP